MANKTNSNIRDRLKKASIVPFKYTANFSSLLMASTKEFTKMKMPTLFDTIEANTEITKATLEVITKPADAIGKVSRRISDNEDVKALKRTSQYMLDDLISGKFYDANRDRSDFGSSTGDLLNDFGGFDMSGFDDLGDWSESETDNTDAKLQVTIAQTQEDNANDRSKITVGAIGNSTKAIVSNTNANNQKNIRLSMKQHAQSINMLNNVVATNSAIFEMTNTNLNNLLAMTREASNSLTSEVVQIKDLLTEIRDNVKPKVVERKNREEETPFGNSGSFDIKKYIKLVSKNADSKFNISNGMSMMTMGMSLKDLTELINNNPLMLVTDFMVRKIIPETMQLSMEKFDNNLKSFFPALLNKMYTIGQRDDGKISTMLAGLFGIKNKSMKSIDSSSYNKDVIKLNGKIEKAVTQVIPLQLSQIISLLSGNQTKIFNYDTGKFEDSRTAVSTYTKRATDLTGGMYDTTSSINKRVDRFAFKSDKEESDFKDYMQKFLQDAAEKQLFINPHNNLDDLKTPSPNSLNDSSKFKTMLMGVLRSLNRDELMRINGEIFDSRNNRNNLNTKLHDELNSSGLMAAFTDFDDPDVISKITRSANNRSANDTFKDIIEKSAKDKASIPTLITDIKNILTRGIITFPQISTEGNSLIDSPLYRAVLKDSNQIHKKSIADAEKISDKQNRVNSSNLRRRESAKKSSFDIGSPKIYVDNDMNQDDITYRLTNYEYSENKKATDNPTADLIRSVESIMGTKEKNNEKTGAFAKFRNLLNRPFSLIENSFKFLDGAMFKVLYGVDPLISTSDKNGEKKTSMIKSLTGMMQFNLAQLSDWFKDKVINPINKTLFDEKDGIFPKLKNRFIDPQTKKFKGLINSGVGKFKESMIGISTDGIYSGGMFSKQFNTAKDKYDNFKGKFKGGINDIGSGVFDIAKNSVMQLLYGKDYNSKILSPNGKLQRGSGGMIGSLRNGFQSFKEFMFGQDGVENDSKRIFADVSTEFKKAAPGALKGAGVGFAGTMGAGLLTSLWLPGGPLLGGIIGAAAGFINSSDRLKNYIFGEEADDGKRKGGLVDSEILEGFKKFAPKTAIGLLGGAMLGNMGMFGVLPYGLSPIIGGVFGSIGGMIASSDQLKKIIFGDSVDPDSGYISKNFRSKILKAIPLGLTGGIGGTALWGTISSLGLIPGLSLLPGGPILAGLGAMSGIFNSEKISNFFFGEKDKTGKTINDGVFAKMFNFGKTKLFDPFFKRINEMGHDVENWFKDAIVSPLSNSMEPIKLEMSKAGENIRKSFMSFGGMLKSSIDNVFEKHLGKPLGEFVDEKILGPLKKAVNSVFTFIGKMIGGIISFPFKMINNYAEGVDKKHKKEDAKKNILGGFSSFFKNVFSKGDKNLAFSDIVDHIKTGIFGNAEAREERKRVRDDKKRARQDARAEQWSSISKGFSDIFRGIKTNFANFKQDLYEDSTERGLAGSFTDSINYHEEKHNSRLAKKLKKRAEREAIRKTKEDNRFKSMAERDEKNRLNEEFHEKRHADLDAKKENKTNSKNSRKSVPELLTDVVKFNRNIYGEIKDQLSGVGYNLQYITTLLAKRFGKLDPSETPENSRGRNKLKRRRGPLGRMLNFIGDKMYDAKSWMSGKFDKVKGFFGFILHPFITLGNVIKSTAGFIKDSASSIVGSLFSMVKGIGSVFVTAIQEGIKVAAKGVATVLNGITSLIDTSFMMLKGAAKGFGEMIGNVASTVSLLGKHMVDALGTFGVGLVQFAAFMAPELAKGIFAIGKGLFKGIGFVGKGLWNGAKFVGRSLFGAAKNGFANNIADIGTFKLAGGFIDNIKSIDKVMLTDGIANTPLSFVPVMRGIPVGDSSRALPVYIAAIQQDIIKRLDNNNKNNPSDDRREQARDLVSDDRDKARTYRMKYKSANLRIGNSSNPDKMTDDLMSRITTTSDIDAIKDAKLLNSMNAPTRLLSGPGNKTSGGFLDTILSLITGGGGKGSLISAVLKLLSGTAIGKGVMSLGKGLLSKLGFSSVGALGGSMLSTMAPAAVSSIGNYNAFQDGRYDRIASNMFRRSPAMAKLMQKGSNKVFGSAITKGIAESSERGVTNTIKQLMYKFLSSNVVQKYASKSGWFNKLVTLIMERFTKQTIMKPTGFITKLLGKSNIFTLLPSIIYDFTSGMAEAANIMQIRAADLTPGLRFAAGLGKALSGCTFGLVDEDWISQTAYGFIANDDQDLEYSKKQEAFAKDAKQFNSEHGTDYTTQEYSDKEANQTWFTKLKNWFTSKTDDPNMDKSNSYYNSMSDSEKRQIAGFGRGKSGNMTIFNQKDKRWNTSGLKFNMADSGCGPTVAAMAASAYGKQANPLEASNASIKFGMRDSEGGTSPEFFNAYGKTKGIDMRVGPTDQSSIVQNLTQKRPVVLMGQNQTSSGPFGRNMHYVVANDIDSKGNVSVVDPYGGVGRRYNINKIIPNTVSTVYTGKGRNGIMQRRNNSKFGKGSSVQDALVQKMLSLTGKLAYTLDTNIHLNIPGGYGNCASTVWWVYKQVTGIDIGTHCGGIINSKYGSIIDIKGNGELPDFNKLQPGDLIFYRKQKDDPNNRNPYKVSHVEMYIGNGMMSGHGGGKTGDRKGPISQKVYARGGDLVYACTKRIVESDSKIINATAANNSTDNASSQQQSSNRGIQGVLDKMGSYLDNGFSYINNGITKANNVISDIFGIASDTGENTSATTASNVNDIMKATNASGDHIGKYVAASESGSKGSSAISSGKGDPGGVSFGTYQLTSRNANYVSANSNLAKFWNTYYGGKHPNVKPGNNDAFKAAWLDEAKKDPTGFQNNETSYMKSHYYDVLKNRLNGVLDPDKHSRAAQEIVWATALQGPGYNVIQNALKGKNGQSMSTKDLINTIQDYKSNTVDTMFSGSSADVKAGVRNRFNVTERKRLLDIANLPPFGKGPGSNLDYTQINPMKIKGYDFGKGNSSGLSDSVKSANASMLKMQKSVVVDNQISRISDKLDNISTNNNGKGTTDSTVIQALTTVMSEMLSVLKSIDKNTSLIGTHSETNETSNDQNNHNNNNVKSTSVPRAVRLSDSTDSGSMIINRLTAK